jgi:FAD/FMN-containing dehydrogenase
LFSVVLGGYGLFGVIVDVQLQVVDNAMYKTTQYVMNSRDYIKMFNQHVKNNQSAGMAYGRINVSKDKFMEEAILSVYTLDTSANLKPLKKQNQFSGLRRTVFRGSVNSDYGKKLRWRLEKGITFIITGREFSRNQLINEGVEVFQNRDSNYSDILQEYFIPVNQVNAFIDSLKKLIPVFSVDLLNITLRDVKKDEISFLNYAKQDVIGFVMLFSQQLNIDAESEMAQLTRKLIDVSMSLNGTYYLPYRLHASKAQFMKAYPEEADFFLLKNKYDSLGIFQNQFYKAYKN